MKELWIKGLRNGTVYTVNFKSGVSWTTQSTSGNRYLTAEEKVEILAHNLRSLGVDPDNLPGN